jgi:uncharacterized protein YcbX
VSAAPRLTGLFRYPVKSCRGTALERAELSASGVRHDRRWMAVDEDGGFLTQRAHPRLCLVRPALTDGELALEAPGMERLQVPENGSGRRVTVDIWSDRTQAMDAGDEAARWLSDFLDIPCRLVRHADDAIRRVDPVFARGDADQVHFADAYPFLLTSAESLEALNERLPEPLPMNRFRPNLVVAGAEAFAEDGWTEIRIGEVVFSVVKPCTRCKVTTVDQETGRVGEEPLRTLADFRRGEKGVEFGHNLIHHGTGTLEVGMAVEVL